MKLNRILALVLACIAVGGAVRAEDRPAPDPATLVKVFQDDTRGPYQSIRWFCPDGTMLPPQERCAEPGGIQHALVKDAVRDLARDRGIYLGQILAGTPNEEFWSADTQFSRAKQYVLERYLVAADDGWILRKARYYRGAFQIEDEEVWGRGFLAWLMSDDAVVKERFFLVRQLTQWVPHRPEDDRLVRIRANCLTIADADSRFMNLRIKIHSQPDAGDLDAVAAFRRRYGETLAPATSTLLAQLEADLTATYSTPVAETLAAYRGRLKKQPLVSSELEKTLAALSSSGSAEAGSQELADLLALVRERIIATDRPTDRLLLMDLSLDAERALFRRMTEWQAGDLKALVARASLLVKAAAGAGFIEVWEYEAVAAELAAGAGDEAIRVADLVRLAAIFGRTVEWSAGMVSATFSPAIQLFAFEPLAAGYVDACLRSSVILALGGTVDQLAAFAATQSQLRSRVMDLPEAGGVRGVNPGYALGTLEVVTGPPEQVEFVPDHIYALSRPPADLSPVAGILTVSEGNPVSHIQLLARNLGIPNAVLTARQLEALQPFAGLPVFYAVSPRGAVVMKLTDEMTAAETQLVAAAKRSDEMVRVPVDRVDLSTIRVLDLRDLRATDSGRLCGPKAANLGQLKSIFPENVVEGIVLPFGVFREHLDQTLPDGQTTYWKWLQDVFARAGQLRRDGVPAAEVESRTIADLARFREMIGAMPFRPGFVEELEREFARVIGGPLGETAVFIRSDTNMEDLRDFTGAGLNLTLFNVRDREAILRGIREVWASPYSERSFRWRQRYLLNPENVFPSILIMPAKNVDKSGVMITAGVSSGSSGDLTVAFSRGVAGAVEGQAAESHLFRADGSDELLSPSREALHTVLPPMGGVAKREAPFDEPVLSEADRHALRGMGEVIRQRLAGVVAGALDVELGLQGDQIWLFQVRPFVENKRAQGSSYLQGLDQSGGDEMRVPWATRLTALR